MTISWVGKKVRIQEKLRGSNGYSVTEVVVNWDRAVVSKTL